MLKTLILRGGNKKAFTFLSSCAYTSPKYRECIISKFMNQSIGVSHTLHIIIIIILNCFQPVTGDLEGYIQMKCTHICVGKGEKERASKYFKVPRSTSENYVNRKTKDIDVIKFERQNGIVIIYLPPHSTHKLHSLGVSFMGPFKHYYSLEIDNWLKKHPHRSVTAYKMESIMGQAYIRADTTENAINGFKKYGLVPFNSNILRDHDFVPQIEDRGSETMPASLSLTLDKTPTSFKILEDYIIQEKSGLDAQDGPTNCVQKEKKNKNELCMDKNVFITT
uniref:DDE-1 domain-containing protein n=1 Tax=Timema genevievae TaxID=629358 RepID=A0A7R9K0J2_TIMGE|nr:unnamed protein product [Timema genevievae]